MTDEEAPALARAWRRALARARHRGLLALAGEAPWARAAARAVLAAEATPALWLGRPADAPPGTAALPPAEGRRALGTEVDLLVCDAFAGLDPDGLGAAAGALRGGGLLLLLAPPPEGWAAYPDPLRARIAVHPHGPEAVTGRYLARLGRLLKEEGEDAAREGTAGVRLLRQGRPPPVPPAAPPAPPSQAPPDPACRTADQGRAVEALLRAARGPRPRPVVLVSARGRGKSAAFGLAGARLAAEGALVLLTAPSLETAGPVLALARRELERLGAGFRPRGRGALEVPGTGGALRFLPPDALAAEGAGDPAPPRATLVLVDEAAALPQPLLERLLARFPRLAFATTVEGYEGTGRGFALRFRQVLERRSRGPRWVELAEPVRWARGDPLEAFLARALLLDAAPGPAPQGPLRLREADREGLAADEPRLERIFGLLREAHYRTRPQDLRHLLDGPNLELRTLEGPDGAVAAVALAAAEGGFGPEEARAVQEGRRRPHGHLLPESLAAHLGLEAAPRLRMLRIVRLAVHPARRRQGLGRRLVEALAEAGRARGLDLLGAAFAADPGLLAFWARCGLRPVRLSLRPSAVSGQRSALVLRALSPAGEALLREAREALARRLAHQLADPLQDLEPELALALLAAQPEEAVVLPEVLWRETAAFAFGRRIYEESLHAAWELARRALGRGAPGLEPAQARALVLRLLQRRPWAACAEALGVPGRAQVLALLRGGLRALFLAHAPPPLRAEALALETRCRAGEQP